MCIKAHRREAALYSLAGTLTYLVWPGRGLQVGEPREMRPEAGKPGWCGTSCSSKRVDLYPGAARSSSSLMATRSLGASGLGIGQAQSFLLSPN